MPEVIDTKCKTHWDNWEDNLDDWIREENNWENHKDGCAFQVDKMWNQCHAWDEYEG